LNQEKAKLQEEILNKIKQNNYNGIVIAGTGIGKGRIMVEVIKTLKPKSILYTCDNKILRDVTFKKEMELWDAHEYIPLTTFECYQTTHKWENKEFDLLLMDEGDFAITPKYIKVLLQNKFKNVLLFTGTLDKDKRRIITKYYNVIHEVDIKEAEDRKVVNKANVVLVNYNLTALENAEYLSFNNQFKRILAKTSLNKHDKFILKIIQNKRRLFLQNLNSSREATRMLLHSIYVRNKTKILIFCGTTEQADKVCRYSFHEKNKELNNLQKFDDGIITVLSVVGKIDRGLNIKGVNNVIFESPTRSKTKTMQRSGRSRRLEVDDETTIYFMIPYFRTIRNELRPTVIMDYVLESGEDLNIEQAKSINIQI
jgi:superfamily II DNA or RNA helicase